MVAGLIDADLGQRVYKKRVRLPGRGKSGSARTLIGTKFKDRWFFLYGFEKSERDSIDARELQALQKVASALLDMEAALLDRAVQAGELIEIPAETKHE